MTYAMTPHRPDPTSTNLTTSEKLREPPPYRLPFLPAAIGQKNPPISILPLNRTFPPACFLSFLIHRHLPLLRFDLRRGTHRSRIHAIHGNSLLFPHRRCFRGSQHIQCGFCEVSMSMVWCLFLESELRSVRRSLHEMRR